MSIAAAITIWFRLHNCDGLSFGLVLITGYLIYPVLNKGENKNE